MIISQVSYRTNGPLVSIAKGGAKSKVLTSSSPPGGGAYSRVLKLKSHNSRPSPQVGEQWLQMTSALFVHRWWINLHC